LSLRCEAAGTGVPLLLGYQKSGATHTGCHAKFLDRLAVSRRVLFGEIEWLLLNL
jgi:hypothetical protein